MSSERMSPFRASCPICSGQKILSLENPSRLFGRKFICAQCGCELKPVFTWRVLWTLPAMAGSLVIFIAVAEALKRLNIKGGYFVVAISALAGLCFPWTMTLYMRSFRYRVATPPSSEQ